MTFTIYMLMYRVWEINKWAVSIKDKYDLLGIMAVWKNDSHD